MRISLGGKRRRRCSGNLLAASTNDLATDHPIAATQNRLADILSTTSTTFGVYELMQTTSLQVLTDLRVLAARIIAATDSDNIDDLLDTHGNASIAAQFAEVDTTGRRWTKALGFGMTAPALITGIGITLALSILSRPTIDEAAAQLRPILIHSRAHGRAVTPSTQRDGNLSPVVHAVILKAFAESLGPVEQLKYRTATKLPRYPHKLTPAAVRAVPASMWPDWTCRFISATQPLELIAPVLSMMLLITGTQTTPPTAARCLGSATAVNQYSPAINMFRRHRLWPNIAEAITRLADYLVEHPSPIDYQRRRQLDYRDLLPAQRWHEIGEHAGLLERHRAPLGGLARCWLFQRVSMQPATLAPSFAAVPRVAQFRTGMVSRLFTVPVINELDDTAAQFLKRHNVIDEPLTWSPPLSLIADLELPGQDTSKVCITDLHRAITETDISMAAVARNLQVPTPLVRHLLERFPLPRPRRQTQLEFAAEHLTRSDFARLYQHEQLTLKEIAARTGINSKALSELAGEYGINIQRSRYRQTVQTDWVYREHVLKRRTITDLAQEIDLPPRVLSRRAKGCGIAIRQYPRTRIGDDLNPTGLPSPNSAPSVCDDVNGLTPSDPSNIR
jgi:AraC-like DNA-binding protein